MRRTDPTLATLAVAVAAALLTLPACAHASDANPAPPVTGGDTPGSFKLPGSNTSVTLGGYVKLDAIFSDPSAGVASSADQELEASGIPIGAEGKANERSQLKLHARQSRLFGKTTTPTAWGELKTYVEGDFFGAPGTETTSNSNGLRVRHAYGSLGHLLAGQTWTTLSDVAAYPETVDFGGAVGVPFARQAQVRWTQAFSGGEWSVALENPETIAALANGTSFRADDDRLPDLAGIVQFNTTRGHYSLAGIVRQLRIDSASAPAIRTQRIGGAIGVNAVVPVGARDDVRASAYAGNAIGRYSTGFLSDAVLGADNRIALPMQWMGMLAYRHFWNAAWRSNVEISGVGASNPAGTATGVNRNAESAHVNLIWSPLPQVNLGVEYIRARREVQGGATGSLNRVQAAAQYLF